MTEFKQIVGRGTRIREDYHKLYFTVMDFKNATRLFADKDFDGEPVTVYEPTADESIIPSEETDPDTTGISETDERPPYGKTGTDTGTGKGTGKREKYYLDNIKVTLATEQTQYLDADGKLVTGQYRVLLKQQLQSNLREQFASLDDFLRRWNSAERKQAVLDELQVLGVTLETLHEVIPNSSDMDVFDLITHLAFDQKPLTRQERAKRVKKRDYFSQYGTEARAVLDALLEKYASNGIQNIEDPQVLEMPPFDRFGTKMQIRRTIFGGVAQYNQAVTALEQALYRDETG